MTHVTSQRATSEIAQALLRARRPLLVAGWGAVLAGAAAPLATLAARLPRLRIASTPKAKGVFSELDVQYVGVVGFAGHDAAAEFLFEAADYVLVVGSRLGELTSNNWDARWKELNLARIDVSATVMDSWCPARVTVIGDAKAVLEEVLGVLGPETRGHLKPASLGGLRASRPCPANDVELGPRQVFDVLNDSFPADGHVFSGIGNTMAWGVHCLKRSIANRWHVNLSSGAMGHAIPAAIGAALTGAESLAVVGDAEFLMTGYELHTAVENAIRLTVIVLNDAGHGMVRIGSRVHCHNRAPSFEFTHPVDLVAASKAQGARAFSVRTTDVLRSVLRRSMGSRGPTVIEVPISREAIPPLGARLESLTQSFGNTPERRNHD